MAEIVYVTLMTDNNRIDKIVGIYNSKGLANTAMLYERARTGALIGNVKVVVMEINASYTPLDMTAIHQMSL